MRRGGKCLVYLSSDALPKLIKDLLGSTYDLLNIGLSTSDVGINDYVVTGDFLVDTLKLVSKLLSYDEVNVIVGNHDPYLTTLVAMASSVIYDRVSNYLVRLGSRYVRVTPSLTHALSGRGVRDCRLRIVSELGRARCLSISELASKLGLSESTVLRHVYTLSKAGVIRKYGRSVCRSFTK